MLPLMFGGGTGPRLLLCLGAHPDDIEIGAGGTILTLIAQYPQMRIVWCVLSGTDDRRREADASARAFCAGAAAMTVEVASFRDGHFPYQGSEIKLWFEGLKQRVQPDVILSHALHDAHQDHREVGRLTWNTFRHHLILEYEIPKYDGDLGRPNAYVPLSEAILDRKMALLVSHYATQRERQWFDRETFRGLARIRGIECAAAERFAEAFHLRKCLVG